MPARTPTRPAADGPPPCSGPRFPPSQEFTSPRAWAFSLLGLDAYCAQFDGDAFAKTSARASWPTDCCRCSAATESNDWCWFEDGLAYDNPRLSQAMIQTGLATRRPDYVEAGLRSLRWLMSLQTAPSGCFRPVGTESFGKVRQLPDAFDQQPVEALAAISACLAAARADGGSEWPAGARRAFAWFLGENDLKTTLIDSDMGSCSDGLHPDRPNENSGAESVLSYLLGLVEMRRFERAAVKDRAKSAPKLPASRRISIGRGRNDPEGEFCPNPSFSIARPCTCARIRRGSWCDPSDRQLSRGTSTRSTGRRRTISSAGFFGWSPKPRRDRWPTCWRTSTAVTGT